MNASDFELRQENGQRHARENGEMQRRPCGSAQSLGRIRARGAANAGSGGGRPGCAERSSGAENRADIPGVLHSGKDDEKRGTGRGGRANQVIERSFAWLDQRRNTLGMFGICQTLEKSVSSAQRRKTYFRAVDQRSEAFVMALAGLAEEHRLDGTAGAQCFFDEAHSFDADVTVFGRQATAENEAELLEPAIVAAGQHRKFARTLNAITCSFAWRRHIQQVSKFGAENAKTSQLPLCCTMVVPEWTYRRSGYNCFAWMIAQRMNSSYRLSAEDLAWSFC